MTCHDTAVGVEPGAFMVARTGDGRGWLAHLTTHLDLCARLDRLLHAIL